MPILVVTRAELRKALFLVFVILGSFAAYPLLTPEETRDFSRIQKEFRVLALRDGKPFPTTLATLPKDASYLLPASVYELPIPDVHKVVVLENMPGRQLVEYEYANTVSTVSRYRAFRDRVEPVSHRMTFHPGLPVAFVLLMLPAWLLAFLTSLLWNVASPPPPAPAPAVRRRNAWSSIVAVVHGVMRAASWARSAMRTRHKSPVASPLTKQPESLRAPGSNMWMNLRTLKIVGVILGVGVVAFFIAAVSLPAYCDYTPRAKMSEVVLTASACRTAITEIYQAGGKTPAPNAWGCEGSSSKYVTNIATDSDGRITVTIGGGLPSGVDGKPGRLTLVPMVGGKPARTADLDKGTIAIDGWRCGHPGDGTTVSPEYLPGTCGGRAPKQGWTNVVMRSNAASCGGRTYGR